MRKNRIIASLMALLMTLSAFSGLYVPTYAASEQNGDVLWNGGDFYVSDIKGNVNVVTTDTTKFTQVSSAEIVSADGNYTITYNKDDEDIIITHVTGYKFIITDYESGSVKYVSADAKSVDDYAQMVFATEAEKLFTMEMLLENNTHKLYVQKYTGEIACYDKRSEQTLFTNPYDIATITNKSQSIKNDLMSQIILKYTDKQGNTKSMTSYADAVLNGQVNVKVIKSGIRVDYILGRQESNYLLPCLIEKDRFETLIRDKILNDDSVPNLAKIKIKTFYELFDPNTEELPELLKQMHKDYPITKKGVAVYALTNDPLTKDKATLEEIIKKYCPDYTYEELEYDHSRTEYVAKEEVPANFKMSIEYSLTEDGLTARLPANGIRYDATTYTLNDISFLPYMGAGSNENTGYVFMPDGSGAITKFEDYKGKPFSIKGTMYGTDYAYHTVEGKLQETMRFPVFGIVDNVPSASKGFFAIIEKGDAMVSITSTSGANTHKYYNVVTSFSPRQRDTYRLSDSISVGTNSAIVVESARKYVGSLQIKYMMLTDSELAQEKNITNSYETSWMGMAKAYRGYLLANGTLNKLSSEDIMDKLPLYIESFGTIETTEKIASIPVKVDKALTSFADIKTMYNELSEGGVTNVNFKLQGYYNGGMYSTAPYKLKWQKAAGGADGFTDLVKYSKEKNFGVYPDFDFAYLKIDENFDGFSAKEHSVKTIDNRYSSRIMYNAASQSYSIYGGLCISPSAFTYLFEGLDKNYTQYGNDCISVSSLGYALNSDFDEDEPYNREDSKEITKKVLSNISSKYKNVMSEGGNAFTLGFVDHLLDVSLDSSRYALTSAAVPFVGVVLHGSVNFAGSPINMEGHINYALLKSIENGASLYFILSYDNTELLKEDSILSQYYSVRYDIWKKDVIEIYTRLNNAIGDLQDKYIVDHEFLSGSRVPDPDEVIADQNALDKANKEKENNNITKITNAVSRRVAAMDVGSGYTLANITKIAEIAYSVKAEADVDFTVQGNVYTYADGIVLTIGQDKKITISLTADALSAAEEALASMTNVSNGGFNKYATTFGTIVKVTYEGGTTFILNYNDYSVVCEVDGFSYTIPKYSFVTIKTVSGKTTVYNFNEASDMVITVNAIGGNTADSKTVSAGASVAIN